MSDQLRKALEFAIEGEKEAEAFYKEWAAKAKDPAVQGLFAELAGVEHGHVELLSRIAPADMIADSDNEVATLDLSDVLIPIEASENMSIQAAMILAMKREEAAVKLYTRLAEYNGEAHALFEGLANEERRHKVKLEKEYDDEFLTEN